SSPRRRTEQLSRVAVSREETADALHDACLARPVRAEQAERLPGLELERDAVDRPWVATAVALAEILHAYHCRHGLAATIPVVVSLDRRQQVILIWCAVAVVITAFEGSVLVIALPAVATEFNANTPALSDLGSVLAVGTLGALPLSTLADRFGRRRLIAVGVAGSSLANLASGFAPSIAI